MNAMKGIRYILDIMGNYKDDIYEISLGKTARECKILCNGKDIIDQVQSLTIEIRANCLTEVTLKTRTFKVIE